MQKVQIIDHELFIYEIHINRKGLRKVQKNTLRKAKNLTMYTESVLLKDYPTCFRGSDISSSVKAKMFQKENHIVYTTILYPDIVRLMEEFRNYNFDHLSDLVKFNHDNPTVVSKILENIEFKEIYHDTYNDYFDLLEKLKMYGDSSIRSMVEDIDEKVIPNEMNFLIKKKGSRKSM